MQCFGARFAMKKACIDKFAGMIYNNAMLNVAVTEDDGDAAERLCSMIDGYAAERGIPVTVTRFGDAAGLLSSGRSFDVVFMDIGLPDMSGMEAARRLRETDGKAVLIFCTTMAQFAVDGYSVGAFDYLIKPLDRASFDMTFAGAVRLVERGRSTDIAVRTADGAVRLNAADVLYVEIFDHRTVWHTDTREILGWGSLKKLAAELKDRGFALCNSCYLVNLRRVRSVSGDTVTVGDRELHCSRAGIGWYGTRTTAIWRPGGIWQKRKHCWARGSPGVTYPCSSRSPK